MPDMRRPPSHLSSPLLAVEETGGDSWKYSLRVSKHAHAHAQCKIKLGLLDRGVQALRQRGPPGFEVLLCWRVHGNDGCTHSHQPWPQKEITAAVSSLVPLCATASTNREKRNVI